MMTGCKSPSRSCAAGKPPLAAPLGSADPPPLPLPPLPPLPAPAPESTATLHKLALATGGTEKSWYRCVFPFGIVSLVIGVAATCITFSLDGPRLGIAKLVSVAALLFGLALLAAALLCWRAKRRRRRREAHGHKQAPQAQPEPAAL